MSETAFAYVALDASGRRRRGRLEAAGEREAYRKVADLGLTPVSIRGGSAAGGAGGLFSLRLSRDRVSPTDVSSLTRELGVLVEARIPLARGLVSIAEQERNEAVRDMVLDIARDLESGRPLTVALAKHEREFGSVYVNTVRAAEASGNLGAILTMLAEMLERQAETARQLRRALSYPAFVTAFVFLAVTVIVVFVVPRFSGVFAASGADLPIATKILQGVSDSVRGAWYAYAGALAAGIGGLVAAWRSPGGRRAMERAGLRVPILGRLVVAITAARFCRVLSIALGSGLELTESVDLASAATGRPVFAEDCARATNAIRNGSSLREALAGTPYLPAFAQRVLGAGNDAREIGSAAEVVARHFDRESDHLSKTMGSLIEPAMTVALSGIVLLVALAVFLPMWQMVQMNG